MAPDPAASSEDYVAEVNPPKPVCLNCDGKMPRKAIFCPHCGQRNNRGKVAMKQLLERFWGNFSHLDGKFVKMCWQLFVPARVTLEYFAGRQKRYPHPVQFFFVVMFFFLLTINRIGKAPGLNMTGRHGEFTIGTNTVVDGGREIEVDNVHYFNLIERYVLGRELRAAFDSLPAAWQTPVARQALDSVVTRVNGPWERLVVLTQEAVDSSGKVRPVDSIPLNFINRQIWIASADLVRLEPDSILRKYGIEGWSDRVLVRQGIKSLQDSGNLMSRFAGSIGWTVLVLISLMSGLLYLLYRRQKRFYVEHFVFLMHQNSGAFLLLTLLLLVDYLAVPINNAVVVLALGWIAVALLIAMRRFYGQSWFHTFYKWLIYCSLYGVGFILVLMASLLAVFVVF
jgi:ribosomal protein L40E